LRFRGKTDFYREGAKIAKGKIWFFSYLRPSDFSSVARTHLLVCRDFITVS
jgi:hypothetical protein